MPASATFGTATGLYGFSDQIRPNLKSAIMAPYLGAPGSSVGTASFHDYLEDNPASLELLDDLRSAIRTLGPTKEVVTKSQVAFKSKKTFAWAWSPGQYLGKGAPLVLTVSLPFRDRSSRWKEIVESSAGRFTHHLELRSTSDIDAEVLRWLEKAHRLAG